MDLREWLFKNKIKITPFAKTLEYDRGHLTKIVNGQRNPSKRLAKAIEAATNGEVSAEDLLNRKEQTKGMGQI
jgi:DNA-binding transcriptional regulator YdaS (Cro superfamily)